MVFTRWGKPKRMRVDNGHPWDRNDSLPEALSLWLIGLGIEMVWNPPARPWRNGKVERFHGVIDRWVAPERLQNGTDMRAWLDWATQMQREIYPSIGGVSRAEAFPQLHRKGQPYDREHEPEEWCLGRVQVYLAQGVWRRLVGKKGQITIYNRAYSVGQAHARESVEVRYAPETNEWVITDENGVELARHQATEITAERIRALQVSYVKPGRRKEGRCRRYVGQVEP